MNWRENPPLPRSPGIEKGGGRDKRVSREQEITGKAFSASGRTYPNRQGIEALPDTPDSDSSESHLSEHAPLGLLPVDQVEADSGEEMGITTGYDSKSGGSDNDEGESAPCREAQAKDHETIRKAGRNLVNNDNI